MIHHYLFCRNGFQRLDKIKDSTRQSKQLEELTDKMRECKRYTYFIIAMLYHYVLGVTTLFANCL